MRIVETDATANFEVGRPVGEVEVGLVVIAIDPEEVDFVFPVFHRFLRKALDEGHSVTGT